MIRIICIIIMLLAKNATASDIEREQRLAAEIEDSIIDGDVVCLDELTIVFS